MEPVAAEEEVITLAKNLQGFRVLGKIEITISSFISLDLEGLDLTHGILTIFK